MMGLVGTLGLIGPVAGLALVIWILVDLARLRRHPDFQGPFSGNLNLHLMALGLRKTSALDQATRRKISSIRKRILLALLLIVLGLALRMFAVMSYLSNQ